jgi:indole-3-glycerol phosphate synthase
MSILAAILDTTRKTILQRQKNCSIAELNSKIAVCSAPRDFIGSIRACLAKQQPAIIAEIKKASPSQGVICENFNPVAIAKSYEIAGATCLSILTEEHFFQGSNDYLQQVRAICNLPILRKDFIIDPYQIYETRAIGADCLLLIVAALTDIELKELVLLAQQLKLAILIETHNEEELRRALKFPGVLIGINNRNLNNFITDLNTTISLQKLIPADRIIVTESGIKTKEDVAGLRNHHVNTFLVGETFMRSSDPGEKLKELFMAD